MKNKKFIVVFVALALISGLMIVGCRGKTSAPQQTGKVQEAKYWTCGMHPSVRVTDAEYRKGKVNCPICNMPLIPVEEKVTGDQRTVTSEKKIEEAYYGCGIKEFGHCPKCDEGKPNAQCICGEHRFVIKGEKITCPVCKRELKKLSPEEISTIQEATVGSLSLSKRQLGLSDIATSKVFKANIFKEIRTVGKIAYDPELNIAQEEFVIALETYQKVSNSPDKEVVARAKNLLEKSRIRLKILGISEEQIKELEETKTTQASLILPEDKVWVYAEVYEYELSWIKEGLAVKVTTQSYPGEEFAGVIRAVSPILDPNTRSAKVRLEIDNPDRKLKLEMFVDVFIEASLGEALAVNGEAILDTGIRKVVWVDKGEGNFHAREIKTGAQGIALVDGQKVKVFPVLSGLAEGEFVVTKGNFLIDSQSQIAGPAEVVYGGALVTGEEKEKTAPVHRH